MERRNLLKGVLAVFGAGVVGASLMPASAQAAPLEPLKPETDQPNVLEETSTEALDQSETDAEGQYYYRRRPRRVYYRRRVYRRPVYYRRPRRVYYRPRRVYYRRPRRVYYRRYY